MNLGEIVMLVILVIFMLAGLVALGLIVLTEMPSA
jgi:hypothetical protein